MKAAILTLLGVITTVNGGRFIPFENDDAIPSYGRSHHNQGGRGFPQEPPTGSFGFPDYVMQDSPRGLDFPPPRHSPRHSYHEDEPENYPQHHGRHQNYPGHIPPHPPYFSGPQFHHSPVEHHEPTYHHQHQPHGDNYYQHQPQHHHGYHHKPQHKHIYHPKKVHVEHIHQPIYHKKQKHVHTQSEDHKSGKHFVKEYITHHKPKVQEHHRWVKPIYADSSYQQHKI